MFTDLGLYLHIPFCVQKCGYCDFYSLCRPQDQEAYINALLLHMQDYRPSLLTREIDTVFIGGGTPTSLPQGLMLDLIDGIKENFNLAKDAEFTMESNPATVSLKDLRRYRKAGVNRLSIGLQSFIPEELSALGRIHTTQDFEQAFRDARDRSEEHTV